MDLTRYVDEVRQHLVTAAAVGGDEARALADRLTAPLDTAVRLVLLDALSGAAAEITAEVAPATVEVRLRGRDPELVVVPGPAAEFDDAPPASRPSAPPAPPAPVADADDAGTSRTTLRLPDHLKVQVEAAAARDGLSVNAWLVRAVAAALQPPATARPAPPTAPAGRLTGWVR